MPVIYHGRAAQDDRHAMDTTENGPSFLDNPTLRLDDLLRSGVLSRQIVNGQYNPQQSLYDHLRNADDLLETTRLDSTIRFHISQIAKAHAKVELMHDRIYTRLLESILLDADSQLMDILAPFTSRNDIPSATPTDALNHVLDEPLNRPAPNRPIPPLHVFFNDRDACPCNECTNLRSNDNLLYPEIAHLHVPTSPPGLSQNGSPAFTDRASLGSSREYTPPYVGDDFAETVDRALQPV